MNPVLSRRQVRRLDELAVERYGLSTLVLMENAGRNAATLLVERFGPTGQVLICCGSGNNGGDGYVVARHLYNQGWSVRLMTPNQPTRMTSETRTNHAIVEKMGLETVVATERAAQQSLVKTILPDEIVVDALLGTGFTGEVRSPTAEFIKDLNDRVKRAVVAIDVPSGLDCDTGVPSSTTIRADVTITFVAPKKGFLNPAASSFVGSIEVADIGAPRDLLGEVMADRT